MGQGPHKRREDPTAQLSPTARRLVAAARKLLARDGFAALTVEAVAAEAGAYRDSVRYYFGSKAAFVAAVVDSLAHDQSLAASDEARTLESGGERVHGLVLGERNLVDDRDAFRDFFAIFPHVLHDEELRWRIAELYEWYRALFVDSLSGPGDAGDGHLRDISSLMTAVTDGLAVQKLLDPESVDLEALFGLWERMLRRELEGGGTG
jgi:TetR/AcrR family transcriptional regulator, regulator of biofilm formation and stress response